MKALVHGTIHAIELLDLGAVALERLTLSKSTESRPPSLAANTLDWWAPSDWVNILARSFHTIY